MTPITLQNGAPSTWASYLEIAKALPDGQSAIDFVEFKIRTSPQGADTEITVEEPVMMWLLRTLIEHDVKTFSA